ncbi:oxygen-independent coproporphyrinogen III oxidase [Spiroplasma helicoides]|uniref:Heme chaperone HemW n=1 Tax=Spiroplasma helicoides TaxID=216938 RepID=A0A1B3SK14_9MOLU|nr:radical SAM family heme chaperone HemW [Spiroplasma helicoides]AOG60258.1 oxygen-independent coproporphyrinogen III oxidase [Spiroplasma helicoides]
MKKSSIVDRKIKSLYVHIPFCEHICFYCDFVKIIKPKDVNSINKYLNNLQDELASYGNKFDDIKSIYIGGGTPSCLEINETIRMCEILSSYKKESIDFEYSIELNPESITKEKLEIYKQFGINRLSIGVQTFDNNLLKKIGRIHDNSTAIEKYQLAREVGFSNISIDLMYNLFDQKLDNIKVDLEHIKKLKPDHISWYSLIMKEDSVWGKKNLKLPGNDELFDEVVSKGLKKLGYDWYEVSNYCLNNKYSRHNVTYWNNSLFAGVGVGASGFEQIDGQYFLTVNKGNYASYKKNYEKLSTEDYYFQVIMMGLRMVKGIDLNKTKNKTVYNFYRNIIDKKIDQELLEVVDNFLRCTKKGFNIMNEILVDFL